MNLLMFIMVAAMFVHTFLNFFVGVYSFFKIKASNFQPGEITTSVEDFLGTLVLNVTNWFKKSGTTVTADVKAVATDVNTVVTDVKKL